MQGPTNSLDSLFALGKLGETTQLERLVVENARLNQTVEHIKTIWPAVDEQLIIRAAKIADLERILAASEEGVKALLAQKEQEAQDKIAQNEMRVAELLAEKDAHLATVLAEKDARFKEEAKVAIQDIHALVAERWNAREASLVAKLAVMTEENATSLKRVRDEMEGEMAKRVQEVRESVAEETRRWEELCDARGRERDALEAALEAKASEPNAWEEQADHWEQKASERQDRIEELEKALGRAKGEAVVLSAMRDEAQRMAEVTRTRLAQKEEEEELIRLKMIDMAKQIASGDCMEDQTVRFHELQAGNPQELQTFLENVRAEIHERYPGAFIIAVAR